MARRPLPPRTALLLPAAASLLTGLWGALLLLGVIPSTGRPADLHGLLMIGGFLGAVISLERAVALRQSWAYLAPGTLAFGALLGVTASALVGTLVMTLGAALFTAAAATLWRRQFDSLSLTQVVAAVMLTVGLGLWPVLEVRLLLPLLVGFVVLTIAAERVELARIQLPGSAADAVLAWSLALFALAMTALLWPPWGQRLYAVALLGLVAWLALIDVVARRFRIPGLARFMAAALTLGYLWLVVAASVWLVVGVPSDQASYDTIVHAVFLGFAMAMVMAHAPLIVPSIVHRDLPHRALNWLPLIALQAGLVVRFAGAWSGNLAWWRTGGVLNEVALVLFLALTLGGVVVAARQANRPERVSA